MMRSFKSIYYVIPAIYYLIWINLMGTSCLRGLRLQTKQVNIKKKQSDLYVITYYYRYRVSKRLPW